MSEVLPFVDPRGIPGAKQLTPEQIAKACQSGGHVLPAEALHRIGRYTCVYCGALVHVHMPLIELVKSRDLPRTR